MKIVKADAKGRVTGMEPGESYEVEDSFYGTTLRKVERDTPWKYHDVTLEQFEQFYGQPIGAVRAGEGTEVIRSEDAKGYYPNGVVFRVLGTPRTGDERKIIIRVIKPE